MTKNCQWVLKSVTVGHWLNKLCHPYNKCHVEIEILSRKLFRIIYKHVTKIIFIV